MNTFNVNAKAFRSKEKLLTEVSKNFNAVIDFVVRKTGPVKTNMQAAKLVGLEPGNLTKIQQGIRSVPLEAAVRACDIFGCSYDFMFRTEGDMFSNPNVTRQVKKMERSITKQEERLKALEKKLGRK